MNRRTDKMDRLLVVLGKAHQNGAFSGDAAHYPWQSGLSGVQNARQRRLAWMWMVGPLAAAAAVVVLFVGPNFFPGQTAPVIVQNVQNQLTPQHPEVLAIATTSGAQSLECDYNGDGVVNGEDIQPMIDRLKNSGRDPRIDVEKLTHCLLGG